MNNYYVKYMLSNKLWLKRSNLSIDEALTVFSDVKETCVKAIVGKVIEEEFAVYDREDSLDLEVYNSDISPFLAQLKKKGISYEA